jgi:hypothetical protein
MFKWPWNLGPLDTGPIFTGYLGLGLFCLAAVAIGLLISALTDSQSIAFFITFFVLGVFWFSGTTRSPRGQRSSRPTGRTRFP